MANNMDQADRENTFNSCQVQLRRRRSQTSQNPSTVIASRDNNIRPNRPNPPSIFYMFGTEEESSHTNPPVRLPELASISRERSNTNGYFVSGQSFVSSFVPVIESSTALDARSPIPVRIRFHAEADDSVRSADFAANPNLSTPNEATDPFATTPRNANRSTESLTTPTPDGSLVTPTRHTKNMVNFNQFLSQHNWPASPVVARSSGQVNLAIEQMMQKSIAIRKAQMSRETQATPANNVTSETPDAPTRDFSSFLHLMTSNNSGISERVTTSVPPPKESVAEPPKPPQPEVDVCVICLVNPKEYCIPKCNHLCLCQECSEMFQPNDEETADIHNKCPLCRKLIQGPPFKIYR